MSDYTPSLETPPVQPKIMSAFRKYGKYDNFKTLSPSITSLGSKYIGKIYIDCQFLFQESEWGTLHGRPGGIMYVNLNFGPPSGCRVRDATVTITLDDDDPCLQRFKDRRPREGVSVPRIPVTITEWYGPLSMEGEKKSAEYVSTTKAVPEVNVAGNGVGGIGHEQTRTYRKEARWSFTGQLLPGERTPLYKSLRWDLNKNELESQSFHNTIFRTAFAFEHSGQPFIIKVEIEGTLAKLRHQIKSKLKFDGARGEKVATLVDFEDHSRFSRRLDTIAEGLPSVMRDKNLELVPNEIPDSIARTTSQQVLSGTPEQPLDRIVESPAVNQEIGTSQPSLGNSSSRPMGQSSERNPQKRGFTADMGQGEQPSPTFRAEDWRSLLAGRSHRTIERNLGGDLAYTTESITRTLVDVRHAPEDLNRAQEASAPTAVRSTLAEKVRRQIDTVLSPEVDRDSILTMLGITIMILIMCIYADG